jgi:hypothetical protein
MQTHQDYSCKKGGFQFAVDFNDQLARKVAIRVQTRENTIFESLFFGFF